MRAAVDDHYEVLGVSRTAEQSQVKAAFLRLIALHPPENDPEQFRLISEAYHVVGNPKRRRAYDAEERLPTSTEAELAELVKRAEDDPRNALPGLRTLGAREPGSKRIRFQLGVVLTKLELHREAAAEFQALFDLEPSNSHFAVWLGDGLCDTGEKLQGRAILKQATPRGRAPS